MFTSRLPNADQNHNTKSCVFKDLATKPTNQIFTNKESNLLPNSANLCYLALQNFLSFLLLSNNIKIKIHRTITLLAALYGCET